MIQEKEKIQFKCNCQQYIDCDSKQNLQQHLKKCEQYTSLSPLYGLFKNIPIKNLNLGQILAIQAEIENHLDTLDVELKTRGYNKKQQNEVIPNSNNLSLSKKFSNQDYQHCEMLECPQCNKLFFDYDTNMFWYLEECIHFFCKICIVKEINTNFLKNYGQVKCMMNSCQKSISYNDYNALLGQEKMEQMNQKLIDIMYSYVKCCQCEQKFEFQPGNLDLNIRNEQNQLISEESAKHYADNRFSCLNCKTEQCKQCKFTPYHKGYTCEQYIKFQNAKHCRYCDQVMVKINSSRSPALQDICSSQECETLSKNACNKILKCGHSCTGYVNEQVCGPCINDKCVGDKDEPKGSDYCNICFCEGLSQAPTIVLGCGHVFHYHCVEKRLKLKWFRPRITFGFCLCPLCKVWMQLQQGCQLQQMMIQYNKIYERIKELSLNRLKQENRDKDERLSKIGDVYYQKPLEYSLAIFSYYQCFKCKQPYFGGLKSCEAMQEEERAQPGQKADEYKPEDLICGNCCEIPSDKCPTHGKQFIEFKCKFCCSTAQWFCWGTTHFCDPCHKRQCQGEYLSNMSKDKLPKCPGKAKCPLQMNHKENGEECSLGCSVCRINIQNSISDQKK